MDGKGYPYEKFTFKNFENCIENYGKFNGYFSAMEDFCNDILDSRKLSSLAYILFVIMQNDDTFDRFVYGGKFVSKQKFFDVITEPEQVSIEMLLIGLLYYVHKKPSEESTDNLHLKNLQKCNEISPKNRHIKMTLNVLLALVIQAKHNNSNNGKGRLLVRFLDCIADDSETEIRKKFFDDVHKGEAFHKIDRLILRFIPKGKGYPYEKFKFKNFENCIGKPDRFRVYLADMRNFCNDVLNTEKINLLVHTLLEIMWNDDTFDTVVYGGNLVSKQDFFGTVTTPKQVCVEALLLGLLYHVHKNPSEENADNLELKNPPEFTEYCIVRWEGKDENLNTDIKITPLDIVCRISGITRNKWNYLHSYVNEISDNQMNRFLIQYAMPFVAYEVFGNDVVPDCRVEHLVSGNDIFTFVRKAFDVFLSDEKIYYSYTSLRNFNKITLLNNAENTDFIQVFISSGFMEMNQKSLCFVHENIMDYFIARHILNLLGVFVALCRNSTPDMQKKTYYSLNLNRDWFNIGEERLFEILGDICGDSENIKCELSYRSTVLDRLLDIYRNFNLEYDEMHITENVMKTMSFARNKRLCGVDFSRLPMPSVIPYGIKFTDEFLPCSFRKSHIYTLNIFENYMLVGTDESGLIEVTENWARAIYKSTDGRFLLIQFEYDYAVLWDIAEHKVVSEVDFTKTDITEFNISHKKSDCLRDEIYKQIKYFKKCDFRGAVFHDNDYRKKLKTMEAIVD